MYSLHSFSIFALVAVTNAYSLVQTYDAGNFLSEFNFFTAPDPTLGFVEYVNQAEATGADELFTISNNQVYIGVDHTEVAPSGGRESVRVTSNQAYTQGVFIADIQHMPVGCGTWPAYWMFGPNWPNNGEIDIIEGVHAQPTNQLDLHTGPGCSVNNDNSLAGTNTLETNCNLDNGGTGCGASTGNTNAYGAGFNAVGGGVYAMQWASSGIYVWFFQRGSIPSDITNNAPNVQSWGKPMVSFNSGNGGCDFESSFANHNIVFDTTFCGQWAGSVWGSSSCASKASTCQDFVANNPTAFVDAYWLINSIKIYQ